MSTTAPIQRVAHDSGDGATVRHCPMCGGGQVVGRSDGTIECEFCGLAFTVQIQPVYSGFPQTVNGMPSPIPGMPGQIGGPPLAPGPMDAMPPGAEPDDGGNPFADDADPADAGGDGAPPFADDSGSDAPPDDSPGPDGPPPPPKGKSKTKKSSTVYRTVSGARLSETAYVEYLAVRHADVAERAELLERLRQSRAVSTN